MKLVFVRCAKRIFWETRMTGLLAFQVEVWGTESTITFAKNKQAAKYNVFKALKEAGYCRDGSWPAMSVARFPEFDNSVLKEKAFRRCFAPEYIKGT